MPADSSVELMDCPHGPMLLRGATRVQDAAGEHIVTRSVVALCRCARSSRKPWCDGTHKLLKPAAAEAGVARCEVQATGRTVTVRLQQPG